VTVHCDIRKFNFANRVVSLWNSLPEAAVRADTVDRPAFKNRLDKFWQIGKHIFTGSRSQVSAILE